MRSAFRSRRSNGPRAGSGRLGPAAKNAASKQAHESWILGAADASRPLRQKVSKANGMDTLTWEKHHAMPFLRQVGVRAGDAVLDFGCGQGVYAKAAARLVGARGTVYALDKNSSALDALMRAAAEDGLTNIRRVDTQGTMPLCLQDASVNVVLLYDVLHLVSPPGERGEAVNRSTVTDRRRVLKEVRRVLKPSGIASVYCPHLPTHTDVRSEEDIIREFQAEGFAVEKDFGAQVRHNGSIVRGRILTFVRRGEAASDS